MIRVNLLPVPDNAQVLNDNCLQHYFNFFSQVVHSTSIMLSRPVGFSTSSHPASRLSVVCGRVSDPFVERVLARLSEAELKVPIAARDDIRVAWITVLKADEGHPTPFAQAFYQYFSISPDKMIPFLSARADIDRMYAETQARWLEKYLPFRNHHGWQGTFAQIQLEAALPPKKPSASLPGQKKEAA